MSSYNSNILHMTVIGLGVVHICSHSGSTYHICRMVAETISAKCTEHSYQHSAPHLALMLCKCL